MGALAAISAACGGAVAPRTCPPARWPDRPVAPATSNTATKTFAIFTLRLGDEASAAAPGAGGWTQLGFDLDGVTTSAGAADACRPSGGSQLVQVDGQRTVGDSCVRGIDNAFGASVVPLLREWTGTRDLSSYATELIRRGRYTLQLKVSGFSGEGDATGLTIDAFTSGTFDDAGARTPAFRPDEDWPILDVSAIDPKDPGAGAKERFADAYVAHGTLVSDAGMLTMGIPFANETLLFPIRNAVVTMSFREDGAADGVIGGVIRTEELIAAVRRVAARASQSSCGAAFDAVADQLRQAADILGDGTNRGGATCDAISVGIGFEARRIGDPMRVVPDLRADPCP